MPQYYRYAGEPQQYNATARIRDARGAAESRGLGNHLRGELGSRYTGSHDLGASNFGGQNKDLSGALLSDNEKRLAAVAAIGIVGWFFLGPKIKKALKKR